MRDRLIGLIEKAGTEEAYDAVFSSIDDLIDMPRGKEYLADYLISNGVIVPPCKVGDKVYQTDGVRIYESTIINVVYDTYGIAFDERAIGESIFLTREEAEKALKERAGK